MRDFEAERALYDKLKHYRNQADCILEEIEEALDSLFGEASDAREASFLASLKRVNDLYQGLAMVRTIIELLEDHHEV